MHRQYIYYCTYSLASLPSAYIVFLGLPAFNPLHITLKNTFCILQDCANINMKSNNQ